MLKNQKFSSIYFMEHEPLQEALYLTDIANSDCSAIIDTLNVQGEKLENIKNKNERTKNILSRTDKLTKKVMKRKRIIGVITTILFIIFTSIWIIYKI
ncbi:hypothetical protein M153_1800000928 [Pseudoloma neurophilia]|uniref:Uncharacterized protein n=1 Tax=Pseudoloma neurophilia TaxID=146866 RepID=A0A0R0M049_9MICR|nr:hypothetical protein M153_1800000928 [Pseudoloma neurophilia]